MFDNQNYHKTADLHADFGLSETVFMSTNVFYHISANATYVPSFLLMTKCWIIVLAVPNKLYKSSFYMWEEDALSNTPHIFFHSLVRFNNI